MAINVTAKPCYDLNGSEKMPCCDDVTQELKVEEITTAGFDFDASPDLFEITVVDFVLLSEVYLREEQEFSFYQDYPPPLPSEDLYLLFETYLI